MNTLEVLKSSRGLPIDPPAEPAEQPDRRWPDLDQATQISIIDDFWQSVSTAGHREICRNAHVDALDGCTGPLSLEEVIGVEFDKYLAMRLEQERKNAPAAQDEDVERWDGLS